MDGDLTVRIESLVAELQVDEGMRDAIQLNTIGQRDNPEWFRHRKNRITASVAGRVYKLQDSTDNTSTVTQVLYPPDISHLPDIRRGIDLEPVARKKYEDETRSTVLDCGLFISLENGIFAASPDGLVGFNGIVEIKCTRFTPAELCNRRGSKILVMEGGVMKLNRNHNYYNQVVMQIHVAQKDYCDFVIYNEGDNIRAEGVWYERIQRTEQTEELWNDMMRKLERFFREDMAPEILEPKHPNSPFLQPPYRVAAIAAGDVTPKRGPPERAAQPSPAPKPPKKPRRDSDDEESEGWFSKSRRRIRF